MPRLIEAVEPAGFPPDARIYMGSYGINERASAQVRSLRQGRYAPMFPVQPGAFWEQRRLSLDDEAKVGDAAHASRVPSFSALLRLSARQRSAWGRELGRRYRDSLRAARREGVRVDSWQFDELMSEATGPRGRAYREFLRGVLAG